MSNDYITYMNGFNVLSTPDMSFTTLLSLPNETLDHIIQALAGEPALEPSPQFLSRNRAVHNIRLVNRRLAALGSCYILFRHRCASERQLEHETTHLTEEGKLRRRYTKQLEIDNVPILYWISALQNLYPVVTHMSLINVRLSSLKAQDQPAHSPYLVLASVKHISIQVNNGNEADVSTFLRSFPNLVTLLLDSDPACYSGMKTKLLLSCPPLPYLTTLYRPPLEQTHLTFSNDLGYTYSNTHDHPDFAFHELCNECLLWSQHTDSSEQITVTQLAWLFPSLREVLIPRLVFEDWMRIVGLSSDESLPMFNNANAKTKGLDWIECMRRQSDVVTWMIESDNHADCIADCPRVKQGMENAPLAVLDPAVTGSSRPTFHVVRPRDYNEHLKFKKTKSLPVEDSPKFWWTKREKTAFIKTISCSHGSSTGEIQENPQGVQESAQDQDDSRAKLFGRWDL